MGQKQLTQVEPSRGHIVNHNFLQNSAWRGPLMVAMQRSIVAEFNTADWHELGYLMGLHDYIQGHPR